MPIPKIISRPPRGTIPRIQRRESGSVFASALHASAGFANNTKAKRRGAGTGGVSMDNQSGASTHVHGNISGASTMTLQLVGHADRKQARAANLPMAAAVSLRLSPGTSTRNTRWYVPNTLLTGVIIRPGTSAEPRRTAVGLEKSAGFT